MTQEQHTPGPWVVTQWDEFPVQQVITDETGSRCLALVDRVDDQDIANAWLISAAPDLLSALERLVSRDRMEARECVFTHDEMSWLEEAESAIAKANGK